MIEYKILQKRSQRHLKTWLVQLQLIDEARRFPSYTGLQFTGLTAESGPVTELALLSAIVTHTAAVL